MMLNKMTINYQAIELRKIFGEDENSYIDIFNLVENSENITLFYYPMKNVSGMCIFEDGNKIIGINSCMSRGRQRFTIAHELYHLFYHIGNSCYVCSFDKEKNKNEKEKEANQFASYFIAPYNAFKKYVDGLKKDEIINLPDVIKIEQYFGMSHISTLWRLLEEGYITQDEFDSYSLETPALIAKKMGYSNELYAPTPEEKQKYTSGQYIRLVNQTKEKDLISNAKYEEMLLSAYRADLVFGNEVDCGID